MWLLNALTTGVSATVTDSGVLSRGAIINRLEAEVSRSRRYANPLSCITVQLAKEVEGTLAGECPNWPRTRSIATTIQSDPASTISKSCEISTLALSMIVAEQYFSADNSIARSTAAALRSWPVITKWM